MSNRHEVEVRTEGSSSELGALKLDADEIAAFEKWATEPNKPTSFMVEAAKAHRVLRLRQKLRRLRDAVGHHLGRAIRAPWRPYRRP
jgi:hypothetical protein